MNVLGEIDVVWWAWGVTCLAVVAIAVDVARDVRRVVSARNVVLIGLFMWYLLEALQGGPAVREYGTAAYQSALALVCVSGLCFLLGYHRSQAKWFDRLGRQVERLRSWPMLRETLLVGILIGSVPLAVYALADPTETLAGLVATRHGWRGTLTRPALGDFRASVLMLENFLLGAAWVAMLILGDRRRTSAIAFLAAIVLMWFCVRSYGTGSRSLILQAALVPAAWYYWRCDPRRQKQLIPAMIPIGVFVYWFAGALAGGRDEGRLELVRWPVYVGHEMFRELLFVLDQVPAHRPYLNGRTFLVELINPIPRFLWEGKPLGFGIVYAQWHGEDPLQGGPTMSPGIIGEMYVNFGVYGVVALSALAGVACRAWDRLGPAHHKSPPALLFYSIGLGCILMMGRSFSIQLYYPVFATLITLALIRWRIRRLCRARLRHPLGHGPLVAGASG